MNNKGAQALLKTDFLILKSALKNIDVSVSTTDISGVNDLNLPFKSVVSPFIDVPYETADLISKKKGYFRFSLRHKLLGVSCFFNMFIQILLSVISAFMVSIGLKAIYRNEVFERIKECDVVVSCSDENFKENASLFSLNFTWRFAWWSMLFSRTCDVLIAKFLGKKVVMFPNSIGPFQTWVGKVFSKLALGNFECILAREGVSFSVVKNLNVGAKIIRTSDSALLYAGLQGISKVIPSKNSIGVCLGLYSHVLDDGEVRKQISSYAKVLDEVIEKFDFNVVFLPHYINGFRYDDLETSQLVMDKMKNKDSISLVNVSSVDEFTKHLGGMNMVVSSKMHPAVIATSMCVPTFCIAYDQKQTGFFNDLELSECLVCVKDVCADNFRSKINYVWNNQEKIADQLNNKIPALKNITKDSIELVLKSMLQGAGD